MCLTLRDIGLTQGIFHCIVRAINFYTSMQKKLLISAVLALILIGGVVFVWQKKQDTAVVSPENIVKPSALPQGKYPQHITEITGSDEVWYSIPELGVRMRLNRGFAEDLVYIYSKSESGVNEDQKIYFVPFEERVDFSTYSLQRIEPVCVPGTRSIGEIIKVSGDIKDWPAGDYFDLQVQFPRAFVAFGIPTGQDNPNTPLCLFDEKSKWYSSQVSQDEIQKTMELMNEQSSVLARSFSLIEEIQ